MPLTVSCNPRQEDEVLTCRGEFGTSFGEAAVDWIIAAFEMRQDACDGRPR